MKNLLSLFLVLLLLSGCSIFKKRSVNLETNHSLVTSENSLKLDSTNKKTSKVRTTETEDFDTTVIIPGKKVTDTKAIDAANLRDSLIKGVTLISNSAIDVKTQLDTLTGKLTTTADIKPQQQQVKGKRTKTTDSEQNEETAVNKNQNNKDVNEQKSKAKGTIAEPKGLGWLYAIIVTVVVIIVAGIIFYFWNNRRKKQKEIEPGI